GAREKNRGGPLSAEGAAPPPAWRRLTAGPRLDLYFFDVTSDNPRNSGTDNAARASPKLSVIFGPWAQTELFANFGYGFHSNDARGVPLTADPSPGAPASKVPPLVLTRGAAIRVSTQPLPAAPA